MPSDFTHLDRFMSDLEKTMDVTMSRTRYNKVRRILVNLGLNSAVRKELENYPETDEDL